MDTITHWRHHLQGAQHKFVICTDHKALCYFHKPQKLLPCQTGVMQKLSGYKLKYKFVKGELKILPVLLSCNPAMYPVSGDKDPQVTVILESLILPVSSPLPQTPATAPVVTPQLLAISPAPSSEEAPPLALPGMLLYDVLVAQHSFPDGQAICAKLSPDSASNGPILSRIG
ncbi:hypothetical protein DSO57_1019247 [Entomophthora muscae]|uniref:Uncharacterized protein n=1 Tax=Entomophthora muscae TaxID=34485 RepID=A0ACC2UDW1_9FUNG|nr:hypothetical protein DSO57_1019247 [Entomophthora muscae]